MCDEPSFPMVGVAEYYHFMQKILSMSFDLAQEEKYFSRPYLRQHIIFIDLIEIII